ncbi:hypothetical protein [Halochromatium glycolicum]|jgi:hypothetical protein|uniref:Uncharacterized protein n=1 Tax=Halochromatium glycolicum TaxID=85075 RepID=A0AAJ0U5B5_9GAMM|nr:hypothetical protein [Halochromatium glycolicum]MBK1705566.1 hypothetical protein [Halochromatium glycolicum]
MRISPNQWDSLASVAPDVLAHRLFDILNEHVPESLEDDREVTVDAIAQQIKRARGYRLESEYEVSVYVLCALLLGDDFDERFPEAGKVLALDTAGRDKAQWLRSWTEVVFTTLNE